MNTPNDTQETTAQVTAPATTETPDVAPTATVETPAGFAGVLIDRANDLGVFASTDPTRYVLNGIHFSPRGTEATDGRIAARVGYAMGSTVTEADNFIVPTADVVGIVKRLPKKATLPEMGVVRVEKNCTTVALGIVGLTLGVVDSRKAELIDGLYPSLEQVWPKEAPTLRVCIAAGLLAKIAGYVAKNGVGENPGVTFEFTTDCAVIKWGADVGEWRRVDGVVMPMRGG